MTGPWPHPKTGILYYRKATPPDIRAARKRLAELCIRVTREVQRSLQTRDRKPAEKRYREIAGEIEAQWDRWRALLKHGPQPLSHKQQVALAAERAGAFLAAHEDDPFSAPPSTTIPDVAADNSAMVAMLAAMNPETRRAFLRDLKAFVGSPENVRRTIGFRLLDQYPGFKAVLAGDLAAALEAMHGGDTDAALAKRTLHTDPESHRLLNLQMADLMGVVRRGLDARQQGDYSELPALANAPAFEAASTAPNDALSLEHLLDHKAKTGRLRAKTVSDHRSCIRKFVAFIGHDDARRVTKDDVRRWRDCLIETGLSPKTISDKYVSALRAVLAHGVKEFDLAANAASGIADNRAPPAPTGSKGYTEPQALAILGATLKGSSKALSEPHRRALFWVPWILAYTGQRVTEVTQLQGRHVRIEDGIPHLIISPADGNTKSGRAWAVGIHSHLVELGFLEFVREAGLGPLFYEPYPDDTDVTAIKGRPRAAAAGNRIAAWIRGELGIKAPLGRPNHAWRHLFTTRSRQCKMDKEARDYMMGSRPATDAREGYGDWSPAVLDAEINKLPRFAIG